MSKIKALAAKAVLAVALKGKGKKANAQPSTSKNGAAGMPFGTMKPPQGLANAVKGQQTLEQKLMLSRNSIKTAMGSFYKRFHKAFPKATYADFARQFDKTVPMGWKEYRVHPTYVAIDNMFRYMPEIKGKKVESRQSSKTNKAAKERASLKRKVSRAERLVMAIANQLGIPRTLLMIAANRVGYSKVEQDSLWAMRTKALVDVSFSDYVMAYRKGPFVGQSVDKVLSAQKVKQSREAQSVPTPAELANAAKSGPTTTVVRPASKAQGRDVTTSANVTQRVYKGKGLYQRVLRKADNLSTSKGVK